jgi:hypothetical protein
MLKGQRRSLGLLQVHGIGLWRRNGRGNQSLDTALAARLTAGLFAAEGFLLLLPLQCLMEVQTHLQVQGAQSDTKPRNPLWGV